MNTILEATTANALPDDHPIYAIVRQSYPGFDAWLDKVRDEQRPCWIWAHEGTIVGLAILAEREPGVRKLCTFCCSPAAAGTGRSFLEALIAAERAQGTKRLCGEVLKTNPHIRRFFRRSGFCEATSTKPDSVAIVRVL